MTMDAGHVPISDPGLLAAMLDGVGVPVLALDARGRVVLFNRACQALSGYAADAVLGRPSWRLLLPADQVARARAVFRRLLNGDGPRIHRSEWLTRDGSRTPIEWIHDIVRGSDGTVTHVLATGLSLSVLQRAEDALQDAQQRTRAILDTAVDGVITIDAAGRIDSINPAAQALFGYRESELVGENVRVLMPSPYREEHDAYLRRYLETGEKRVIGIGREVSGLRRDGSTFPMELAVGEFEHQGQRYFAGIVRDMSERHAYEQELRQRLDEVAHLSRVTAIGDMATGLAHEVNQPLGAIVSYAQACLRMLDAGRQRPETLRRALTQIAAQGRRAGDIIQHLRRFMRQEGTARGEIDLNQVVEEAAWLLEHEIALHRISLELALEPNLPAVRADRTQIEQVVLNLMRNAIDAMQQIPVARRRLQCRSQAGAPGVEVSVCDQGKGLSEEQLERVFQPFFTTKDDGMGQGLSICRSIVHGHGGDIAAIRNAGHGMCFTFSLPASDG